MTRSAWYCRRRQMALVIHNIIRVEPTDALLVLRADAGLSVNQGAPCVPMGDSAEFDGIQRTWGDFDCNHALSPVDALKILQYDSGFVPAQSAGCPEFGDVLEVS